MAKINQVVRFEPFNSALSLRDAMDRLFEDSVVWPRAFFAPDSYRGTIGTLALNMYETPEEVVVTSVLPGIKSEDVSIQFEDGRLIIDATIPAPKTEEVTWHYRELAYGHYHRELSLPVAINTDKVEATLQDGYLTLHLPKAEEVKPKKIQVKTASK
jgi:HSP20 family protein